MEPKFSATVHCIRLVINLDKRILTDIGVITKILVFLRKIDCETAQIMCLFVVIQGITIWNDKDYHRTQTWSIVCDRLLSRCVDDGTMFELRQGDVTLLITVRGLPHFNLVEEVLNGKGDKFVLRMNSETSV